MNTVSIAGKVARDDGTPVANAQVRVISDLRTLGAASQAAVSMRTAVTWTRQITGFAGHRWNAYVRYVANEVAGITFAEFKQRVVEKNPSLQETAFIFLPGSTYTLPENTVGAVEVRWDRRLSCFRGNRWQCWRTYVVNKVVGITWTLFKDMVVQENPTLANEGYVFQAGKSYALPRNPHLPEYEIVTTTDTNGHYAIKRLPVGNYRVEVVEDGQIRSTEIVEAATDLMHDITPCLPLELGLAADDFVRVAGTQFVLRGKPFKRFVGVNITGILHYGETYVDEVGQTKKVIDHSEAAHRRQALEEARDIGARVVRVFLPHYSCKNEEVARRLAEVLKQLQAVGAEMYLIPVFIDLYHNRGFFPFPKQEVDNQFYAQQGSMRRLLPKFFVSPFCPQYLSLVDHIVGRFATETRILAWEIGNELKLDPAPPPGIGTEEFVKFNHFIAERIKRLDSNHLVATGMKSTQHPHMLHQRDLAERLYNGRRPNGQRLIDFITVHSYVDPHEIPDEKLGFELDAKLARALGMPIVVEETGVSRNAGDHRARLEEHMKRWFDPDAGSDQVSAGGFMEWGFCPQGVGDGSGDNFSDRAVIKDVYSKRSRLLAV